MRWAGIPSASPANFSGPKTQAKKNTDSTNAALNFYLKYGPLTEAELLPQLVGIDAVIAGMDPFKAAVLGSEEAATLKIILRWGVGIDAVDLQAAARHGIFVANTPGLLNEAVADYAMALLLTVARRVSEGSASLREKRWDAAWGPDLLGKTLSLVGCGGIGQAVAKRARF